MKNSKLRNIPKKILLILLGIGMGIVSLEIILNFSSKLKFETMIFDKHVYRGEDHENHKKYFRPSKTLGIELIPKANEIINSFGMRDKEYTLKKPEGVFRILVLGDSITCFPLWTDYLEEKLVRDGKYEVLNCAVSGLNLYGYYLYFKHKCLKFNPDLVLIGFCLNDITCWDYIETIFIDNIKNETIYYVVRNNDKRDVDVTLQINPFLFYRSYIYRFIVAQFFIKQKYKTESSASKLLQEIKNLSNNKILGVIFPYLKPLNKYDEREIREYQMAMEELEKAEIEYLDLTPHFIKYGENIVKFRDSTSPWDKVHFNDEANRIKSEVIYQWIKDKIKEI